jgi:adenylate cyclase
MAVNTAHQQLSAKLGVINSLRAQKAASKLTQEQQAIQVLIDIRSTEAQPLIAAYVTAVNTFVGTYTTTPTASGPTGPSA